MKRYRIFLTGCLLAAIASGIQACTFTFINDSADSQIYITDANIGRTAQPNKLDTTPHATFIDTYDPATTNHIRKFGPNVKHIFVYMKYGPLYYLVKEARTTRCGSQKDNVLLLSDIVKETIEQKQPKRFTIKTYNENLPMQWQEVPIQEFPMKPRGTR